MSLARSPGLRGRTLRSFLLLGAQRVVGVAVTAAGSIALARLLSPEVFGLYAILVFVISLGVRVSELGLGAALVQRRDLDPATGLGVAFTATFGLALVLGIVIAAAAPLVARWPGVSGDVTAPVRWLAVLVVLSSFRMPATVLLERRLAYLPLTAAETADTVTFYAVAVGAAMAGAGLWSFVAGALAARAVNLVVLWSAARWRPTLALELGRAGAGDEVRHPVPGQHPGRNRRRRGGADVRHGVERRRRRRVLELGRDARLHAAAGRQHRGPRAVPRALESPGRYRRGSPRPRRGR